jgi:hypothetical protein
VERCHAPLRDRKYAIPDGRFSLKSWLNIGLAATWSYAMDVIRKKDIRSQIIPG